MHNGFLETKPSPTVLENQNTSVTLEKTAADRMLYIIGI
jgi:hypothetical protein